MSEIRMPVCPLCGMPPFAFVSPSAVAFCDNDECGVFCWDMTDDPSVWDDEREGVVEIDVSWQG